MDDMPMKSSDERLKTWLLDNPELWMCISGDPMSIALAALQEQKKQLERFENGIRGVLTCETDAYWREELQMVLDGTPVVELLKRT